METRRLKRFVRKGRELIAHFWDSTGRIVPPAEREKIFADLFREAIFWRFRPTSIPDDKESFSNPPWTPEEKETLLNRLDSLAEETTRPEDWTDPIVCGWLHQFFISGRKRKNRQGVVDATDLAASTQLFTPDWIANYLVANTLGKRLLEIVPDSTILKRLPFLFPSNDDPSGNPSRTSPPPDSIDRRGRIRKLQSVTFLDPSCGTGHLLLAAYDLLASVYRELGVKSERIPQIILSRNLIGLDLDPDAVKMAREILFLKAEMEKPSPQSPPPSLSPPFPSPSLFSFPSLTEPEFETFATILSDHFPESSVPFLTLLNFYRQNREVGSLLRIPGKIRRILPICRQIKPALLDLIESNPSSERSSLLRRAVSILDVMTLLARRFDVVVTNPPYLGVKGISETTKRYVEEEKFLAPGNLYSLFIERASELTRPGGWTGIVAMESWLFLPTFQNFRRWFLSEKRLESLAHLGTGGFGDIPGEVVATAAFCFRNSPPPSDHRPLFFRLTEEDERQKREILLHGGKRFDRWRQTDFLISPDASISYWIGDPLRKILQGKKVLGEVADLRQGLATGDNRRFLRRWFEVAPDAIHFDAKSRLEAVQSGKKWFPYNKGGRNQRWFGGTEFVVNWGNDGEELRANRPKSVLRNPDYYFRRAVTWSLVTRGTLSPRFLPAGSLFDVGGSVLFPKIPDLSPNVPEVVSPSKTSPFREEERLLLLLGFLGSRVASELMKVINPTVNYQVGDLARLPFDFSRVEGREKEILTTVRRLITLTREDHARNELSPKFVLSPLLPLRKEGANLPDAFDLYWEESVKITHEVKRREERNHQIFLSLYGLDKEFSPHVPLSDVTLYANPYRNFSAKEKGTTTDEERKIQFRARTAKDLLSYFVGLLLGRWSPEPTGNDPFSPQWRKVSEEGFLLLDAPSIRKKDRSPSVPLSSLLDEFLTHFWSKNSLDLNRFFLAGSLPSLPGKGKSSPNEVSKPNGSACPEELLGKESKRPEVVKKRIDHYFREEFFIDHEKRYFHLPIYWRLSDLFRSVEGVTSKSSSPIPDVLIYYHRLDASLIRKLRDRLTSLIESGELGETARTVTLRRVRILTRLLQNRFSLDFDRGIDANRQTIGEMIQKAARSIPSKGTGTSKTTDR